jgi:hypothetical protein
MWNVSSATSLAIDNGVGDVTGRTSITVSPQATTTYTLTATNSGGSVSSTATVTVNAPTADTQPPSTPATLWASPASSTEVSLQWSASTDNVGITGYQIWRNGAVLTSVPGSATSYVDRTAVAATTYTYAVRAYDAAGNYSALSPNASATTPGSPTPAKPALVTVVSGSYQTAVVGTSFTFPLRARVLDASAQPVAGVTVTFTAPAAGATAMFTGSGNMATALTDASGIATSPTPIANGVAGTYPITASVAGVTPAVFTLTNTSSTPPPPSGALSIWGNGAAPTRLATFAGAVELGLKFRSDITGKIAGVRFYKHSANGGTHRGSLWSADGKLLATGTFTGETASGWQTLMFATPVSIAANTTYVASYHTSSGTFAITLDQFVAAGVDNGTLHALRHGVAGPNGVVMPGTGGKFPIYGTGGDNFWVDVIFTK